MSVVLMTATASANPVEGPNLALWLDAGDIDGDGHPFSGPVHEERIARWADKSAFGNHAAQPLADRQPTRAPAGIAGRFPSVHFSATEKQHLRIKDRPCLDCSQLTVFLVAKAEANQSNMWFFGKNCFQPRWTGYGLAVEGSSVSPWPHLGLGRAGPEANGCVKFARDVRNDFALVELVYDGQRLSGALNGRRVSRVVSGPVEANDKELLIGAGPQADPAVEFLEGDIAELLLYNRALGPAEQEQTRQYLVEKYGLTLIDAEQSPEIVVIENGYLPVTVENAATPRTRTLSPEQADAVLRRDWLFQADGRPTFQRALEEIGWTRQLAARLQRNARTRCLSTELAELDALEKQLCSGLREPSSREAAPGAAKPPCDSRPKLDERYCAVRRVKRRIAFSNPAIDFDQLLFIDQPYPAGPEWKHEAIHRMGHRAVPGGRLLALDGLGPGGQTRQLFPPTPGSFWRPELSFDAKRVLFSYKAHDEPSFHLYEIGLDGADARQLTHGQYDDIDPIYLPDGHLLFTTTRGNTYVRCGPYIYSTVLARCDADGRNVYLISTNSEPDFVPALLHDGRVIYSRWEYSDKDQLRIQSLWTTNPDGTGTAAFWGNQSIWPDHLAEPRPIPGCGRVMFTGVGHHDWFSGSLGIVDPARGPNFPQGLTKVTCDLPWAEVPPPPVDPHESSQYHASGRYTGYLGAYPISEEDFLVSARGEGDQFRIYLMDVQGNRELIYEGAYNAWYAIPVKPRLAPPRRPDRVAWPGAGKDRKAAQPGSFFNPDVYQGVPGLAQGSVKYLRVIQQDAKTYSTWHKTFRMSGPPVSIIQEEAVKRIVTTVPVEADGSVYLEAPAGKSLYFQLLDSDCRALQTMRSFTGLMPGERRGCVGCHETQNRAPAAKPALALRREPTAATPPPWGDESIGYERFVQPALDRYCSECHQGEGEGRKTLDLTLRPGWDVFKEPYLTLVGSALWVPGGREYASVPLPVPDRPGYGIAAPIPVYMLGGRYDDHDDPDTVTTLRPMQYLSVKSRLIECASSGRHYKVRVDPLSLQRLIAWVDVNSPYLGEEELRAMDDPEFPGIDLLPVRPRLRNAPAIERP